MLEAYLSLKEKNEGVCEDCQLDKQIRNSHSAKNIISTSQPLDLLHMDLVGPIQTESIGGKKYFLVVVDDYSRFTWVAFLHDKSEAFKNFHSLCNRIQTEKQSHCLDITRIRTDHGTEFENSSFAEFCDKRGIKHEFSAPITPKQNGVVERKI